MSKTLKLHKSLRGFTQVPTEILRCNEVSIQARLLYSILLSYAWSNDEVFPGQATLAKSMGFNEKTVRKYLGELENAELLRRKRLGFNRTNRYTLRNLPDRIGNPVPIMNGTTLPIKNGNPLPPNNTKSNKKRERGTLTLSLGQTEVKEIIDEYEITRKALKKVADKYRHWCESDGRVASTAGLKLFLTRERWDIEDYTPVKQMQVQMKEGGY